MLPPDGTALRYATLRYAMLCCDVNCRALYLDRLAGIFGLWVHAEMNSCSEVPISMQHGGDTCHCTQHHRNKALLFVKHLWSAQGVGGACCLHIERNDELLYVVLSHSLVFYLNLRGVCVNFSSVQ